MEDANGFQTVVGLLAYMMVMLLIMGVICKFLSLLVAILAFPAYLALYAAEFMVPLRRKSGGKLISLHIPKDNPPKSVMNGAACALTLSLVEPILGFLKVFGEANSPILLLKGITSGEFASSASLVLLVLSLAVIYITNYFYAEAEEDNAWTKIENLSIPSLWKVIAKSTT